MHEKIIILDFGSQNRDAQRRTCEGAVRIDTAAGESSRVCRKVPGVLISGRHRNLDPHGHDNWEPIADFARGCEG